MTILKKSKSVMRANNPTVKGRARCVRSKQRKRPRHVATSRHNSRNTALRPRRTHGRSRSKSKSKTKSKTKSRSGRKRVTTTTHLHAGNGEWYKYATAGAVAGVGGAAFQEYYHRNEVIKNIKEHITHAQSKLERSGLSENDKYYWTQQLHEKQASLERMQGQRLTLNK